MTTEDKEDPAFMHLWCKIVFLNINRGPSGLSTTKDEEGGITTYDHYPSSLNNSYHSLQIVFLTFELIQNV